MLTLSENLFLELIDGRPGISDAEVRNLAGHARRYEALFKASEPAPPHVTQGDAPRLIGCRACFGSGGKQKSPCKVCKGLGKVLARPATNDKE